MLDFCDAPYQFFPARPSVFMMGLCQLVNSRWGMPGRNHRIRKLEITGAAEAVREIEARGERILFTPNHSTHSDPQVITEVHRQLGVTSCYMAAYDVFLRSKLNAWVMQRALQLPMPPIDPVEPRKANPLVTERMRRAIARLPE